ncbi:fimbria/pilus outer membrane usher protein [Pseudomonas kairouanensis]|nr:fimbria/pilus outer membrane usher protein [Pseudomonas kairouanensis]
MNRPEWVGGLVGAMLTTSEGLCAPSLNFDLHAFSSQVATDVDMSRFNLRNLMSPGVHRVDIVLNGQRKGRRTLEFVAMDAANDAVPCVDLETLETLGVNLEALLLSQPSAQVQCPTLEQWLPLASSHVDASTLEWTVSIPQAHLNRTVRGFVDPAYWDEGINAGLLNYTFSASAPLSGEGEGRRYLGLNGGVNLGSWRLRHQGAQAWNARSGLQRYQNTATYLQRSLAPWQGQLIVGDSFTGGQILEGIRLRGVSLASDERMLAQSQQGYAPQVRGFADSNATVTISQNGYTLYETTVAPGPFVISDLYATGYGGELTVRVTEVDGRRNTFVVPWSVAPQLLRLDSRKYQLNLGQVRRYGQSANTPLVFQATLAQGISNHWTLYGGGSLTQGHSLGKLGVAMGTSVGAFSFDLSDSTTQLPGQGSVGGRSLGFGYNHNLPGTGTHFVLGVYRYSTRGYLGLNDALTLQARARSQRSVQDFARPKSRVDLSISQKLGPGTLSLYGSSVDFWRRQDGRQTSFTVSYGASWRKLSWNLSAQRSRIEDTRRFLSDREHSDDVFFGRIGQRGRLDNRLMLTLSMPLGGSPNSPSLTSSVARDRGDHRASQQQLGISGLLGENAQGHYGVSASRSRTNQGAFNNVNAYAGVRTRAGQLRAGYAQAHDTRQLSFSTEGGVIAHGDGITWSQSLGEAAALVQAPGAGGAMLGHTSGARIGTSGYGVVPSLRAFHDNVISLDPSGMAMDVELKESVQHVVPTLGAVSLLQFETLNGRAVVVKALRDSGLPLPFAAQVLDEQGLEVGVVGQASKVFVRGVADSGRLTVVWSEGPSGRCYIDYWLPPPESGSRQAKADLLEGRCITRPESEARLP